MGTKRCDDGNLENGDGCSSECEIEEGWKCSGGNQFYPDTCQKINNVDLVLVPIEGQPKVLMRFSADVEPQREWSEIITTLNVAGLVIFDQFTVVALSKKEYLISFEKYKSTKSLEKFEIRIIKPFFLLDSMNKKPVVFSPQQVFVDFTSKLTHETTKGARGALMTTTTAALSTSFITLAVTGSTKLVMKMMDSLQIIPLLPLLTVNFPQLIIDLFKIVKFTTYSWVPNLFSIIGRQANVEMNDELQISPIRFEENGYDTQFLLNSGRFLCLGFCLILLQVISRIIGKYSRLSFLQALSFPSTLIKTFISAYSLILIGSLLQVMNLNFMNTFNVISSILSIIFLIIQIIFPLALYNFLLRGQAKLGEKEFFEKYGALYTEYDGNRFWGRNFVVISLVSKALFCMSLVCFNKLPYFQLAGVILSKLIIFGALISVKPYKSKFENQIQMGIEAILLLLLLFILGHAVTLDSEAQKEGGRFTKAVIGCLIVILAINLVMSVGTIIQGIRSYSKHKHIPRRVAIHHRGRRVLQKVIPRKIKSQPA